MCRLKRQTSRLEEADLKSIPRKTSRLEGALKTSRKMNPISPFRLPPSHSNLNNPVSFFQFRKPNPTNQSHKNLKRSHNQNRKTKTHNQNRIQQ